MVDLKSQYLKIKTEIDSSIVNVIESTHFINGPEVKSFQKELENYLKVKHVIPCANGTDALQIALMSLNLKSGDEIITSNFTFIATIEVIALLGLVPVIVDVNPHTFNIDPIAIEKAITSKTKAIIPVHLFGQCADMEKILAIANKHKLYVIEDSAQSISSDYTFSNGKRCKAGTMGHIGTTSFFPSKNLGTYGDGGAIYTNDDTLADAMRVITNHGSKVKYYHLKIGVNSRLDSIHAAILRIKLRYLDEYTAARQKVALYYDNELKNIKQLSIPAREEKSTHIFHQYTLVLKDVDRNKFIEYLKNKGIPVMIYYPVPFHLQDAFRYLPYKEGDFPVTEHLCKHVISLPIHTEMDEEQLKYIVNSIKDFFKL